MTENASPELSSSDISPQQINSFDSDLGSSESNDAGEVMGDAVRAVQNKHKPQQRQPQQTRQQQPQQTQQQAIEEFIELEGQRYKKGELANLLKELPNYKKGMQKAFNEAQQYKEKVKALRGNDPVQALRNLGYNEAQIDQVLQSHAEAQLKRFQMTPEQRQLADREEMLARREQEIKQFQQQQQEAQLQALTEREIQRYDQTFKTHVEASGLPYTVLEMREMASLIEGNLKKGIDIDWEEAGEQLRSHRQSQLQNWMTEALKRDPSGNLLVKLLPKQAYDAIRKHSVNQVRQVGQVRNEPQQPQPVVASKKETLTPFEWRERLNQKFKN